MSYKVKLNIFEGPFDLLVYLIESARMDIYDIKVAEITEQYLEYIEDMDTIEVEMASEFMVLAAALIELKSKMLLPRISKEGDELLEEDPRTDLVERLLEYRKFKNISEYLSKQEEKNLRVYEKPQEDISCYIKEKDELLAVDTKTFLNAFEVFLDKKKRVEDVKNRYEKRKIEKISSEERMNFIEKLFEMDASKTFTFSKTVQNAKDKYDIALSFVSIMEMVKQRKLDAEQKYLFGEITVSAGEKIKMKESLNEEQ